MKKLVFVICAVMALTRVSSASFEYEFVPSSTDDGSPLSEWGGALFLDAPMSSGGSTHDIDMSDSFLKTDYGTFFLSQSLFGVAMLGPFTWNSATITSMDFAGFSPSASYWDITETSSMIIIPDPTAQGVWVAVPEPTTMISGALLLLPFGSSALRQLRKKLQAA